MVRYSRVVESNSLGELRRSVPHHYEGMKKEEKRKRQQNKYASRPENRRRTEESDGSRVSRRLEDSDKRSKGIYLLRSGADSDQASQDLKGGREEVRSAQLYGERNGRVVDQVSN